MEKKFLTTFEDDMKSLPNFQRNMNKLLNVKSKKKKSAPSTGKLKKKVESVPKPTIYHPVKSSSKNHKKTSGTKKIFSKAKKSKDIFPLPNLTKHEKVVFDILKLIGILLLIATIIYFSVLISKARKKQSTELFDFPQIGVSPSIDEINKKFVKRIDPPQQENGSIYDEAFFL